MTKPQLQQELQARGEPIDGVKWPLNTISALATRVELLLELGFGTAAIAPYAGALPRVMAKVTADPQSSVSEYSYLASLQNTLTEGP